MPITESLSPKSAWRQLRTTPDDWARADRGLLQSMLAQLHLIRAFEEKVLELAGQGLVHGPAHSSIGQEGGAVGSVLALRPSDQVNGSHRGHHQFLAKALQFVAPSGLDPNREFPESVTRLLQRSLAEILGLAQGFCKGRGGSMHLRWAEAGALGTNAIVGGGAPMAAGVAWANRNSGSDSVSVTYFGDGAINIGSVLETMNLAAAWRLPICFFVENNQYAVATTVKESTCDTRLSGRGLGFGIPAWRVDGMDPLAVFLAMSEAVGEMRAGRGPAIVEAEVYRYFHQNGPLAGSAFGYRTKEEEKTWRDRDPLDRLGREMRSLGMIAEEGLSALRRRCQDLMGRVTAELIETPAGSPARIKPELWPSPDFRDVGILGDLSEFQAARFLEQDSYRGGFRQAKFVDVIADTLHRRMSEDSRIVILGEDVHRLKGGTNGATRGLAAAFPNRVLGTPISENAFVGLGGGMAMDGRFVPVVEFMYPDFMWVAADQVFNQIAKVRHMFGGDIPMPLVLRTKVAMGAGYGSQHSMDPAGIFATAPGWRIVAPSTAFDYVGLMNSALRCHDPVIVLEHIELYQTTGPAPADDLDYHIPLGKARVVRTGSALTVLSYLNMVGHCVQAAENLGIDAEIVDLRSLDRASLDWETIGRSVAKTNNVLIVEQGSLGTSYGTLLGDEIQRRLFDWLDQPVERVHGGMASPSISKVLEAAACANRIDIEAALGRVMAARGRPEFNPSAIRR